MTCNVEEIMLYVEGELGPDDAARVRAHTSTCASCRELLLAEQAFVSALGQIKDVEPPTDFASATVRRAECDVRHALKSPRERRHALLVAVVLGGLSVLLLWPTGVLASVVQSLAPLRCIARFAMSWTGNTALSVFIVSRTISRNLLEATSLPVGAALLLLALVLSVLVWLITGYRSESSPSEHDTVR